MSEQTARDIDALIEASSLGTSAARAARESVSDADVQRVLDRVKQLRDEDHQ